MNGRKKFGRILGAAGALLAVGALVMGPSMAQAKTNNDNGGGGEEEIVVDTLANDEITSHNTPGWYEECTPGGENDQGEWHWVITGIDPHPDLADAPQSITVSWSSGPDTVVNLSSVNGSMAHYYYFGHLDDGAYPTGATAVWPAATDATDYNNFNLSHGQCTPPEDDPGITVTKTVEIDYDEYYLWTVDKQLVDRVDDVASADVTYKAVVDRTGPFKVSGSYTVSGIISVENTGNVEVAITGVQDALTTLGSTCEVDDEALPVNLGVDDTEDFAYTCTVPGDPTGTDTDEHTNTATVNFTFDGVEQGPEDSAEMPVDYTAATVDETTDETATLSDDKYPGITPSAYTGDGESNEYTITVDATDENCEPGYTNTATIIGDDTETEDSDSVTVEVCVEQEGPTTTTSTTTTTTTTTTIVVTTTEAAPEFENLPPVPEEQTESGALPQTGWLGTNLTILLGLAMLAAGGLAIGFTRRSAKG